MAKKPMTKQDMIQALAAETGLNQTQAQACLESVVAMCREEVAAGRPFKLTGLGTFSLRQRAARKGVNPATGEAIKIPASRGMAFKASTAVGRLLNPQG